MPEKNNLQSFYRPLTKEWSDVIDADFDKNAFATNPYESRFTNKPFVEKYLKDTFGEEFANSYVDKSDPIYKAASKGDLGPYKAYQGYLQDKGLVPRNTPSIGAELEDWVQRNNRLVSGPNRLYNLIEDAPMSSSSDEFFTNLQGAEHDVFSHSYPERFFGPVDKTIPGVAGVDEVLANFLDPFLGRSGVQNVPDPPFATNRLPNPVGQDIPGAAPDTYTDHPYGPVKAEKWEANLRGKGLPGEDRFNKMLQSGLGSRESDSARVDLEANALEDTFIRDYHKSLGVDMTNYGRPSWWTRNQFAGETPDFFELGQRRFPEMSIQQPTSGAKLLAAMYGQKPPVEEYKLNSNVYNRAVSQSYLPYAHDVAKSQKLTKYDVAKQGIKDYITSQIDNPDLDISEGFIEDSLGRQALREFVNNSYFVDPDAPVTDVPNSNWRGRLGELYGNSLFKNPVPETKLGRILNPIKGNIRGATGGLGWSFLAPEVAEKTKEGDYKGAGIAFGRDVGAGMAVEQLLKLAGKGAMHYAPTTAIKAAPYVMGTLGSVVPTLLGAGIFSQGRDDSLLDQATRAIPDVKVGNFEISNNPETDIGKRSLDFLTGKANQLISRFRN